MAPQVFSSPKPLAHALQDTAPLDLALLTFKRWSHDTPMWLLPHFENPAYHRAKYLVSTDQDGLFVGFGVEKGVGSSLAHSHDSRIVLTDSWAWKHMEGRALDGTLDRHVNTLRKKASVPVLVHMDFHQVPPTDRKFNPESRHQLPRHQLRWQYPGGLVPTSGHERTAEPYRTLEDARTFRELFILLPHLPHHDWEWVDFYIGVLCPEALPLSPATVWEEILEPWTDWL